MSLGSILVRLTMNTADFETDAARAAKVANSRSKEIDAAFKRAGAQIGIAISAGVTAAIAAFKVAVDEVDRLGEMSERLGLTTEEFTSMGFAAQMSGVDIEKFASAHRNLGLRLEKNSELFARLGVETRSADGAYRGTSDLIRDLADEFAAMPDGIEKSRLAADLFGSKLGNELIPLLNRGSEGILGLENDAGILGATLSGETAEAAGEFKDQLDKLKIIAASLIRQGIGPVNEALKHTAFFTIAAIVQVQKLGAAMGFLIENISRADRVSNLIRDLPTGFQIMGDAIANGPAAALDNVQAKLDEIDRGTVGIVTGLISSKAQLDAQFAEIDKRGEQLAMAYSGANVAPTVAGNESLDSGGGGGGLGGEARAAERLAQQYKSLMAGMAERIALFGQEGEAAALNYQLQFGELAALGEAEKAMLMRQAERLDKLRADAEIQEEGRRLIESLQSPLEKINAERERARQLLEAGAITQEAYNRAIEASRTPAEEMLDDLRFEAELLGKTREEQELLNAARWLGAEAATEQGKAAIAALADMQKQREAMQEQIQFADDLRRGFADAFASVLDNTKSAKDALEDLGNYIKQLIAQRLADQLVESLFGAMGSGFGSGKAGKGGSGGGWAGFFSSVFSSFGGGKAAGGPVAPGTLYRVNEEGPELLSIRGRDYLMMGNSAGHITPNHRLGGGRNVSQTVNFIVQGRMDMRTQAQVAADTGRAANRALARS